MAAADAPSNPSSVHGFGRRAKARLEDARARLGAALDTRANGITFTASATEALHLALHSAVASGVSRLIVSAGEHDATLACARRLAASRGVQLDVWGVDAHGVADLAALERMVSDGGDTTLVALMAANNETGVVQPVRDAALIAHTAGARMLVDGVQAVGKIPFSASDTGADYLALSAHKVGGPPGVGVLIAQGEAPVCAQFVGGGQELGRRAGTENVAGICALAAAVDEAVSDLSRMEQLAGWRDALEARIVGARGDVQVIAQHGPRLPNTLSLALPGFKGETQVMAMDLAGFAVSAGSACSSGKVRASHVLTAMGVAEDVADSAIRVSLGWSSVENDVTAFGDAWLQAANRARPLATA